MPETLSVRPRICQQIRSGPLGQWIDDFVDVLTTRVEMASRKGLPTILQVASSCSLRSAADMFRSADSDT